MNLNLWWSKLSWQEQMKVRKFVILLLKEDKKDDA